MNNQEQLFSQDNNNSMSDQLVLLKRIKGLIIGGHEIWQHKMKEFLSSFTFIHLDTTNFDVKLVDNADIIFMYAGYISHAMYYKALARVSTNNKKLVYIN